MRPCTHVLYDLEHEGVYIPYVVIQAIMLEGVCILHEGVHALMPEGVYDVLYETV